MIIYGSKASRIGTLETSNTTCDYCHQKSTQHISVFGQYAHIFWIPFFPIGKKAVSECTHCKRTIEENQFSPELRSRYSEAKVNIKRPIWHWFGIIAIGGLMALASLIDATSEKDPREDLLEADLKAMTLSPEMKNDSISFKLKRLFDAFATKEIEAEDFKYVSRIKDDKVLVLVKMPKLKHVEKEARTEVIDIIEDLLNNQKDTKSKEKYIGIQGKFTIMLVKTPTAEENSKLALQSPLYDFYGPIPSPKK